jgi:hypothetical protein
MWPEKIQAIYSQPRFSWLSEIIHQSDVDRAWVKRFESATLDLSTKHEECGLRRKSLYLVAENGDLLQLSVLSFAKKVFLCLGRFGRIFCNTEDLWVETVRAGLKRWSNQHPPSYLILIRHANRGYIGGDEINKTRLTIFRPPQGERSLLEWYKKQVEQISLEQATLATDK